MTAPILMTPQEIAEFFQISVKTVRNNPARYGLRKIPGVGLRAHGVKVYKMAGLKVDARPE